jgi:hypothetical protein
MHVFFKYVCTFQNVTNVTAKISVFRIRMFLGLLDPDPEYTCSDPDHSVYKRRNEERP